MSTAFPLLPARLIIDLPNWVGDVVMALPTIHRLVAANAGAQTVLYSRPAVKRLLQELFPDTGVSVAVSRHRASPFLAARRLLQSEGSRFDVGVTLRHASRAKIMLRLVARCALGSADSGGSGLLLTRALPVDRRRHQVFDAEEILRALGLDGVDPSWRPNLPPQLLAEGQSILRQAGIPMGTLAGLAPASASGTAKRWPASAYGRLALRLATGGLQPVILIGPGEEQIAAEVLDAAGQSFPVIGADFDVASLAGVAAHLAVIAGNDSGPMHLGAVVGTPVVGLFGPSDPRRTAPLGNHQTVLHLAPDCSPCFASHCPEQHHVCLRSLDPERVAQAVLQLVADSRVQS